MNKKLPSLQRSTHTNNAFNSRSTFCFLDYNIVWNIPKRFNNKKVFTTHFYVKSLGSHFSGIIIALFPYIRLYCYFFWIKKLLCTAYCCFSHFFTSYTWTKHNKSKHLAYIRKRQPKCVYSVCAEENINNAHTLTKPNIMMVV